MIEAYPLCWPAGWPICEAPESSRFQTSFDKARKGLCLELDRLGATDVVISTNIPLRKDGFPYSRQPHDIAPGVAVYFILKGKQQCIPCDKWKTVGDNIHAIAKTIEALRGIARWGSGQMVDAAFTGFQALPSAPAPDWRSILEMTGADGLETAEENYRRLSFTHHPDRGGAPDKMVALNNAITTARHYFGEPGE